jgi:mono/diheme cytochrome c family protein
MSLISGLCFLILLPACKDAEKVSEPSSEAKVVKMKTVDAAGLCPQTRGTSPAPEVYAGMKNVLPDSEENIAAGKQLFHQGVQPITCETCHGFKGNGFGVIFARMQPYPRDFTCYQTMNEMSDGQLFWIIKHGSHGTRMKPFKTLEEDEIWQLIHYVRHFAN